MTTDPLEDQSRLQNNLHRLNHWGQTNMKFKRESVKSCILGQKSEVRWGKPGLSAASVKRI